MNVHNVTCSWCMQKSAVNMAIAQLESCQGVNELYKMFQKSPNMAAIVLHVIVNTNDLPSSIRTMP